MNESRTAEQLNLLLHCFYSRRSSSYRWWRRSECQRKRCPRNSLLCRHSEFTERITIKKEDGRADATATLVAQLVDHTTNITLASTAIPFVAQNSTNAWTRVNFTLPATAAGTTCVDGASVPSVRCGAPAPYPRCNVDPDAHVCVSCGGQFQVGLQDSPGATVQIDYVYLQPGDWGRFAGLPVLASGVATLQTMGVTAVRLGGGFVNTVGGPEWPQDAYFWKRWIGVPWKRPSVGATWLDGYVSGWGPFEFIDMCNAAGIEPVVDTAAACSECTPDAMAELVEYCYGNASTEWGARRIAGGHPEPYSVKYFELGNEQYNGALPKQAVAMETKAAELGLPGVLFYISPNSKQTMFLNSTDAAEVHAAGLDKQVLWDAHVHSGGAVPLANAMMNAVFPNYTFGASNAETNAYSHSMLRALEEGADLNEWFNCGDEWCSRLKFRAASFCTERSGHYDMCDQGISFFLPNMTWLQPPGHVQ